MQPECDVGQTAQPRGDTSWPDMVSPQLQPNESHQLLSCTTVLSVHQERAWAVVALSSSGTVSREEAAILGADEQRLCSHHLQQRLRRQRGRNKSVQTSPRPRFKAVLV
jgi:hypothetical protein